MKKTFVSIHNAGLRGGYKKIIEKIVRDGVCPFCPEHLTRYHKKPILAQSRWWTLTENGYPYTGAREHLLIIHRAHIEHLADITPRAWRELLLIAQGEAKKRGIDGGTFYLRFGDTAYTGASVAHLHANLISPDIRRQNRKPILARVG